jgi:hypothetical protein
MSPWLAGIMSVLAVCLPLVSASADENQSRPTVLELFTSQGCSSCPAADRLFGKYARRDDIVALSFHVDYWDYIGWKDTFATKITTDRQRGYGRSLSQRHLYTPEIVIDGRKHTVGSNGAEIDQTIGSVRKAPRSQVNVGLTVRDGVLVTMLSSKKHHAAEVWLFEIDRKNDVSVNRGENSGQVLSYHHVVRDIRNLGRWEGGRQSFSSDLKSAREAGRDGVVVVVQEHGQGAVLGAAQVWLKGEGS